MASGALLSFKIRRLRFTAGRNCARDYRRNCGRCSELPHRVKLMGFFNRFARGELRLTRIEAFSDGVFAIVVTLLVLELKVPSLHDHGSVSQLGHQLLDLLPKFLSWLI